MPGPNFVSFVADNTGAVIDSEAEHQPLDASLVKQWVTSLASDADVESCDGVASRSRAKRSGSVVKQTRQLGLRQRKRKARAIRNFSQAVLIKWPRTPIFDIQSPIITGLTLLREGSLNIPFREG